MINPWRHTLNHGSGCLASSCDISNGGGVQGSDTDEGATVVGVSQEYLGGRGGGWGPVKCIDRLLVRHLVSSKNLHNNRIVVFCVTSSIVDSFIFILNLLLFVV